MIERIVGRLLRRPSGRFIPQVDGLRFIAIFSVLIYHLNEYQRSDTPSKSLPVGYLGSLRFGVQIFFCISAFVLALPFAIQYLEGRPAPVNQIRNYYLRRLRRIEPPYIISLLAIFLLHKGVAGVWHLAASMAYIHNAVFGTWSTVDIVGWSLEVEVQFYLIAPLIFNIFTLKAGLRRSLLVVGMVSAIAIQTAFPENQRLWLSLAGQMQYFFAGILLADLYLSGWRNARPTAIWDVASVCSWTAIVILIQSTTGFRYACFPLLLAFAGAFKGKLSSRLLAYSPIVAIGGMCYSIYLYHFQLLAFFAKYPKYHGWPLPVQCLLVVPPVLICCTILFLVFEKPFMSVRGSIKAISPVPGPIIASA